MKYLKFFENYLDANNQKCDFQAGDKVTVDNVDGVGVVDCVELDKESGKNDTYVVVRYNQDGRKFTSKALLDKVKHAA